MANGDPGLDLALDQESNKVQATAIDWVRTQRIANVQQRRLEDLEGYVAQVRRTFWRKQEDKREAIWEIFKNEQIYIKEYFEARQRVIDEEKQRVDMELRVRANLLEQIPHFKDALDFLERRAQLEKDDENNHSSSDSGNNDGADEVGLPGQRDENVQLSASHPRTHQELDSGEDADDEASSEDACSNKNLEEDENSHDDGSECSEGSQLSSDVHEDEYGETADLEQNPEGECNPTEENDEDGDLEQSGEQFENRESNDARESPSNDLNEIFDDALDQGGIDEKIHDDVNGLLNGQEAQLRDQDRQAHAQLQMRLNTLSVQFHAQRIARLRDFYDSLLTEEERRLGDNIPQEDREVGDLILDLHHQLQLIELGAQEPALRNASLEASRWFIEHKRKIQMYWHYFQARYFHESLSHPYYRVFDEIPLFGMPYFSKKEVKEPDTKDPLEFALPVHFDHRENKMQKRRPGR